MRDVVLLHCQHSVGLGHLARALALAESLARRFRVVLMAGGPVPATLTLPVGVELRALPPLVMRADRSLALASGDGSADERLAQRRRILLRALDELDPCAVVVDLFPFGRKKLAPELVPLLEAARARTRAPLIVCSLRDILVTGRHDQQRHDDRACALSNTFFDAIFVHGDPRFARLEESFSARDPLTTPLHYTGYLVRGSAAPAPATRHARVVVSAGGGRVGAALLRAALAAQHRLWAESGLFMTAIAGPLMPDEDWTSLQALAARVPGLRLERSVPSLLPHLAQARVAVSQCGYNTMLDLVQSRTPAVLVPYAAPGENEQTRRAHRLASFGLARVVDAASLDGTTLARAVGEAMHLAAMDHAFSLQGANESLRLVEQMLTGRTRRTPLRPAEEVARVALA